MPDELRRPQVPSPRRVGVDSYAYHRLLGETRPGEEKPGRLFPGGSLDVVAEARRLGLDFAFLQTCFLGDPAPFALEAHVAEARGLPLGLSWGAPHGLAFGDDPGALADLAAWLAPAASLGLPVIRIVAGGPVHAGRAVGPLVPLLRSACDLAGERGLAPALENHGDLQAESIELLLDAVGDDRLRVCFDTANALRAGDDVGAAAERLAPAIAILHVKDCEATWDDAAAGPLSVAPGSGAIALERVLEACPCALACIELGQLAADADELALVEAYVDYLRAA